MVETHKKQIKGKTVKFLEPSWQLYISKENTLKYQKLIGFIETEKKVCLQKMIESFQKVLEKDDFIDVVLEKDEINVVANPEVPEIKTIKATI